MGCPIRAAKLRGLDWVGTPPALCELPTRFLSLVVVLGPSRLEIWSEMEAHNAPPFSRSHSSAHTHTHTHIDNR